MVATGVAATATFGAYIDANNILRWQQLSNTITARQVVAGVDTQLFTATWSATTYKYLRISESGGTITFASSTNGTTWTTRATIVGLPFAVTALFFQFGASCGNIAAPGALKIEDFNLTLPALSTNWRWTQIVWPLTYRYKVVTLALDTIGTAQGYVTTADGIDVNGDPSGAIQYWSGPADGGRGLTLCATQAQAQAMAVDIPVDSRFDLPTITEARCIRVYHRSTDGNPYTLREVYPRRLIQSDDIEAESIRAINIAASAVTVDKLDATLTITGKNIQTAYNGARVVLSGDAFGGFIGYGATDTYSTLTGAGTYQVLWKLTDGKFYAGAGNVVLDSGGLSLVGAASSAYVIGKAIAWKSGATTTAYAMGWSSASEYALAISANTDGSHDGFVEVWAGSRSVGGGGANPAIQLDGDPTTSVVRILGDTLGITTANITLGNTTGDLVTIGDITAQGGLNVGTTGAGTGVVYASGSAGFGNALDAANVRVLSKGHDTSATKYAFVAQDSAAATTFYARNDGTVFASLKYIIGGLQVVGARQTGWGLPTGTLYRTALTNASTQAQFNQAIMALITDLHATGGHGLVG